MFPLGFIVLVTALKNFFEDYKRKKSDNEENKRQVNRFELSKKTFEKALWKDLMVGDII